MRNDKRLATCQAPTNEIDHDAPRIFGTVAYVTCGKPMAWLVDIKDDEVAMCERHATDALLYGGARWAVDRDGNEATCDEETGDLRVAS